MELEIRDVQSSATHLIHEKGVTLGRQGGGADLPVPERTISSKHCRIYAKDGKWLIEDLRSSNGTFIANERLTEPVQVNEGMSFALAWLESCTGTLGLDESEARPEPMYRPSNVQRLFVPGEVQPTYRTVDFAKAFRAMEAGSGLTDALAGELLSKGFLSL